MQKFENNVVGIVLHFWNQGNMVQYVNMLIFFYGNCVIQNTNGVTLTLDIKNYLCPIQRTGGLYFLILKCFEVGN